MGVSSMDQQATLAETYGSHDAGTCSHNFLGWALALRGQSGEADRISLKAIALARRLRHPFSLALTHFFAAATGHTRRDSNAVRMNADAAVAGGPQQGLRVVVAWGLSLEG